MEEKVDINVAEVETLAALPGIGMKLAARIVDYRTAVHPFEEVIELTAVPGISQRMVAAIADQVMVNDPSPAPATETADLEAVDSEEVLDQEAESGSETAEAAPDETVSDTAAQETAPETEQDEEPPVMVTMVEAEPGRQPHEERALANPVIRPAQQTVVEPASRRRHNHLWQSFLSAAAGAVFGSLLTLLLLFLLNGTLRFAGDSRATELQIQLETEASAIRQSQSSMADEVGGLAGQVTSLESEQAASDEELSVVAEDISDLEDETAELNERLETIDLAAEKFDTFLIGMRDLLITLQGLPEVSGTTEPVTATTTIPATEGTETVPPEMTPTPTGTAESPQGGSPTRTPRPTATPLIGG